MSLIKRNQEKRKDGKRLFEKIKKQVQGITLIALVVTVIICKLHKSKYNLFKSIAKSDTI